MLFGTYEQENGEWRNWTCMDLRDLEEIRQRTSFVEDLGYLTSSCDPDGKGFRIPGMSRSSLRLIPEKTVIICPDNHPVHSVVYTGHDNDTILGWVRNRSEGECEIREEYLRLTKTEGYSWGMMKGAYGQVSANWRS
ncbi:MAG: 4-alpha-glucanotransferase [Lachnospiraceae bacterium]